jgi:hypothetical protein
LYREECDALKMRERVKLKEEKQEEERNLGRD